MPEPVVFDVEVGAELEPDSLSLPNRLESLPSLSEPNISPDVPDVLELVVLREEVVEELREEPTELVDCVSLSEPEPVEPLRRLENAESNVELDAVERLSESESLPEKSSEPRLEVDLLE